MWTRTKIICTIGPSVSTKEKIAELIAAGMNVARLNFSHGSHEEHEPVIQMLKEVRDEMNAPLAIMLDTKGPEIRIGRIQGGECLLRKGQEWLLQGERIEGNEERVALVPESVLDQLEVGTKVLFDDGYISSHVTKTGPEGVTVQIDHGGIIRSRKGVNIPDVHLDLPVMSEKDIEDIRFGCRQDVDIVAASFVRTAQDVISVKELIHEEGKTDVWVIAKIENRMGVDNLESILHVADGIMVARGDLGVEVPLTQVPRLQKMMIRKSCISGKPAVTATHMLESMISNMRPTRAETSDVANAIYDSTSAVMLSAETAVGKFPIEAVQVMKSIAQETEADFQYRDFFDHHASIVYHNVPLSVTLATVKTAYSSDAKAVFALTKSGTTAALLSRLRPQMPIVALTPSKKCFHQMAFLWGVIPHYCPEPDTVDEAFEKISQFALQKGIVSFGDLVVVTAGRPFGFEGTTNTMMVESIGEVLVRGEGGRGEMAWGNVTILFSLEYVEPYQVRDQILVLTRFSEEYRPFLENARGAILQNHVEDTQSAEILLREAAELNKPAIVRADDACHILKEGSLVTLDPEKRLVYKGIVT